MFVTWRLAGTLPASPRCASEGRAFAESDLLLDRTTKGPQWLRRPEIAQCVVTNLLGGAGCQYEMHSFVVMPNHVHLLLTPWIELAAITRTMKGKSSRQANALLARTGLPFWQDESFDHWICHPQQFDKVRTYRPGGTARAMALFQRQGHRLKHVPTKIYCFGGAGGLMRSSSQCSSAFPSTKRHISKWVVV